jgi:hypothetical protein
MAGGHGGRGTERTQVIVREIVRESILQIGHSATLTRRGWQSSTASGGFDGYWGLSEIA